MSSAILEQVLELVKQLTPAEQSEVARHIATTSPVFTHDDLQVYFERRRAEGATNESLRGKYVIPAAELSYEESKAYLREIGTEWEKEIDEFGLAD